VQFVNLLSPEEMARVHADRGIRKLWEESGRPDTQVHALKKAKKILTRDNPSVFSKEVDAKIHERFKGLVTGSSRF